MKTLLVTAMLIGSLTLLSESTVEAVETNTINTEVAQIQELTNANLVGCNCNHHIHDCAVGHLNECLDDFWECITRCISGPQ